MSRLHRLFIVIKHLQRLIIVILFKHLVNDLYRHIYMTPKNIRSIFLLAFAPAVTMLSLMACKPKEVPITGQVFIVTKGADNVKLGALEIDLIRKEEVIGYLYRMQSTIDDDIKACQKGLNQALAATEALQSNVLALETDDSLVLAQVHRFPEYMSIKIERDALVQEHDALVQKVNGMSQLYDQNVNVTAARATEQQLYDLCVAVTNEICANEKAHHAVEEQLLDAKRNVKQKMLESAEAEVMSNHLNVDRLRLHLSRFPTTEDYLLNFSPVIIRKVFTDADGRFSIVCPKPGAFTLYVSAHRQTLQGTESYYWLIDAPTYPTNKELIFSIHNLTEADPDDYFKVKPHSHEALQEHL
jgi:hypothetical protein